MIYNTSGAAGPTEVINSGILVHPADLPTKDAAAAVTLYHILQVRNECPAAQSRRRPMQRQGGGGGGGGKLGASDLTPATPAS